MPVSESRVMFYIHQERWFPSCRLTCRQQQPFTVPATPEHCTVSTVCKHFWLLCLNLPAVGCTQTVTTTGLSRHSAPLAHCFTQISIPLLLLPPLLFHRQTDFDTQVSFTQMPWHIRHTTGPYWLCKRGYWLTKLANIRCWLHLLLWGTWLPVCE